MNQDDRFLDGLRRAFTAPGDAAAEGADCPPPENLWDAFHGALPAASRDAVLAHLIDCPACAEQWSLLAQAHPGGVEFQGRETIRAGPRRGSRARWVVPLAAAAGLAGLALLWSTGDGWREPPVPVYRTAGEAVAIRSLLTEDQVLRRDRPVLRWSSAGPGARYAVDLGAPDLVPLGLARGLSGTEWTIPPEVLAKIPSGGRIVWRVEARLPDGRRLASPGFRARVE